MNSIRNEKVCNLAHLLDVVCLFALNASLSILLLCSQQVLMSLSRSLSTALLVAEILCARSNEDFKARLLCSTMLISGLTTFLQNTIGIR